MFMSGMASAVSTGRRWGVVDKIACVDRHAMPRRVHRRVCVRAQQRSLKIRVGYLGWKTLRNTEFGAAVEARIDLVGKKTREAAVVNQQKRWVMVCFAFETSMCLALAMDMHRKW